MVNFDVKKTPVVIKKAQQGAGGIGPDLGSEFPENKIPRNPELIDEDRPPVADKYPHQHSTEAFETSVRKPYKPLMSTAQKQTWELKNALITAGLAVEAVAAMDLTEMQQAYEHLNISKQSQGGGISESTPIKQGSEISKDDLDAALQQAIESGKKQKVTLAGDFQQQKQAGKFQQDGLNMTDVVSDDGYVRIVKAQAGVKDAEVVIDEEFITDSELNELLEELTNDEIEELGLDLDSVVDEVTDGTVDEYEEADLLLLERMQELERKNLEDLTEEELEELEELKELDDAIFAGADEAEMFTSAGLRLEDLADENSADADIEHLDTQK